MGRGHAFKGGKAHSQQCGTRDVELAERDAAIESAIFYNGHSARKRNLLQVLAMEKGLTTDAFHPLGQHYLAQSTVA